MITEWARQFPTEPALVDPFGVMTWVELEARVTEYARRLGTMRVGSRVVLYLSQEARSIALLLACARAGIDAILVSRAYPESRAHAARDEAAARSILTLDGDELVWVGAGPRSSSAPASSLAPGREPMVGILTSGSTGAPKCALRSWRSLEVAVKRSARREAKRWLLCYPLSHIAALQVMTQCLVNRSTLVIPTDSSPAAAADAIANHAVHCISSTPTFMRQLLHRSPSTSWASASIEQIILGGEIVDDQILDVLRKLLPATRITHVYATTELGPIIVVADGHAGFDAALLDGQRLKLEAGELYVRRSATTMHGYVGQVGRASADWWSTGDLIAVEDGRAHFRGRTHDVINVGGSKVSPAEVEAVLREVEGVSHVCVAAHPSSLAGYLVKAIVETAPDVDRSRLRGDALTLCRSRLPSHMHPRIFEFVERIDTTVTNKQYRGERP
jgi:acyl-CoA synthetase (AMP-forming)/AMP-acid ligase II